MKKTFLLASTLLAFSTGHSVERQDGSYIWNFLSNQNWPAGYTQSTGKPDNLTWHRPSYSSDFYDRIKNALPEREVNEAFLTDDGGSNITLSEEAEVFITFLHEGAGYKNSFGYFTFDAQNPPQTAEEVRETIVFPNLSYPHLTSGHRVSIGTFPAGTTVGFFIAANGFSYYTGVKSRAVPYYYSIKDLNPDPTDELRQHNVLLFDEQANEVIIGFEDLPRSWGDNDFNDAVFSVKTTPANAINTSDLTAMPAVNDSDADGIADAEDEFPNSFKRAFSAFYPSQNDWVTLAFEDNWPDIGDYDMNDLVVRERLQTIYNAQGEVSGFKITGFIDARGANQHNGFALRLMDQDADLIKTATINIDGTDFDKTVEENQTNPVLILWQDSHTFTQTNGEGQCQHFNTIKSCGQFESVPFTLDVEFNETLSALPHSLFDFFIFKTDYRGREIHFADYPPTDLFDTTQFGKRDDTSNIEQNRFFRSKNNLPWALKVPTNWRYPQEYIDILWAYPDYENWVESAGEDNTDWFETSDRSTHYY